MIDVEGGGELLRAAGQALRAAEFLTGAFEALQRETFVDVPAPGSEAGAGEDPEMRQQITRIPPYRPGQWVKLKNFERDATGNGAGLGGKVRRVRSLTCCISEPEQDRAVWRLVFEDGRCVEWHMAERPATAAEIERAERQNGCQGEE